MDASISSRCHGAVALKELPLRSGERDVLLRVPPGFDEIADLQQRLVAAARINAAKRWESAEDRDRGKPLEVEFDGSLYDPVPLVDPTLPRVMRNCEIRLHLAGTIEEGTPGFVGAAFAAAPENSVIDQVFLDSPGGNVIAAMEVGRILRQHEVETIVDRQAGCASACVLMHAAGARRTLGEVATLKSMGAPYVRDYADHPTPLSIHRPRFPASMFAELNVADAQEAYRRLREEIARYLGEMHVSEDLLSMMEEVDVDDMRPLAIREALELGLDGWDPVYEDLVRARIIALVGKDSFETMKAFSLAWGNATIEECKKSRQCRGMREAFGAETLNLRKIAGFETATEQQRVQVFEDYFLANWR